jgi:hypothetical protein
VRAQGKSHTVCYDFDTPPPSAGWQSLFSPGSSVAYVDSGAISAPTSLLARVPATPSGDGYAHIDLIEERSASKVKLEMDLVVQEGDSTPNNGVGVHGACPMTIQIRPTDSEIRLSLFAEEGSLEQIWGSSASAFPVGIPSGPGARGRVGLWFDDNAKTCGVTFNGQEKLPTCKLPTGFRAGPATIIIGIPFVRPPTSAWAVLVDNVTIDYE